MNNYEQLRKIVPSILEGEKNFITNAANFFALIFNEIELLNWAGFYIFNGKELVLGPFQGKAACVRIAMGKGVCGTSAILRRTVLVDNVDEFHGHIACDSASKSEIVMPIMKDGEIYAVFDIDSPIEKRFSNDDKVGLESLLELFIENTNLQDLKEYFE